MRLFVDPNYLKQREQFAFKATCEHCVHFSPDDDACSLVFPAEPHREALHASFKDGDTLMFCKTFQVD